MGSGLIFWCERVRSLQSALDDIHYKTVAGVLLTL
jgi:hypothetical protein